MSATNPSRRRLLRWYSLAICCLVTAIPVASTRKIGLTYANLLLAHAKVRPTRPRPTLLEIARQSSKELVWSRLLAYFLEPGNGGRTSNLFLGALTRAAGKTLVGELVESVQVEAATAQGNSIDVLVTTNMRVIAIENKLYAGAPNDFEDYRRETEKRALDLGKEPLTLLLTLFPIDRSASGFTNLSWAALRTEVLSDAGYLLGEPVQQHLLYFQECMAMIGNVATQRKLDEKFVAFVETHREALAELFQDLDALKEDLGRQSNEFAAAIGVARQGAEPVPHQYRERGPKLFAVTFFNVKASGGATIAIDVAFEPGGVRVELFCRTRSRFAEFLPRFAQVGISLRDLQDDGRYEWGTTFSRNADPSGVVVGVQALLEKVVSEVAS